MIYDMDMHELMRYDSDKLGLDVLGIYYVRCTNNS